MEDFKFQTLCENPDSWNYLLFFFFFQHSVSQLLANSTKGVVALQYPTTMQSALAAFSYRGLHQMYNSVDMSESLLTEELWRGADPAGTGHQQWRPCAIF